jgi:transcriptional regulator with XRE-family HTH domain
LTNFHCTLQAVPTESDPLSAFRAELKHYREALGLTYAEAGKRAGISGPRWSTIERGYELKAGVRIPANPRRDNLIKMARAVEIPLQAALHLAGLDALRPMESRRISEQPRDELKQLINELSEERVRALLHVARTMTDPNATLGMTYSTEVIHGPSELPDQRGNHRDETGNSDDVTGP